MNVRFLPGAAAIAVVIAAAVPAAAHRSGEPVDSSGNSVIVGGERRSYGEGERDPAAAAVEASLSVATLAEPAAAASASSEDDLHFEPVWSRAVFGSAIGASGMSAGDYDGDGRTEIVLGGSTSTFGANDFWNVAELDASGHYAIVWSSGPTPQPLTALSVLVAGGKRRIFAGFSQGRFEIRDPATRELAKTIQRTSTSPIRRFLVGDADNDGSDELVVVTEAGIALYNPAGWVLEREVAYGGFDAELGNVDLDPQLEIVLSTGKVLQINGAAAAVVEWSGAFTGRVELADVDDDGRLEIVTAAEWYELQVLDADLQSPKYDVQAELDIDALLAADVTGDGKAEILYGDGQWGLVHVLDAATGGHMRAYDNPEHGVSQILAGDFDKDGQIEVAFGCGWTSTGQDVLRVVAAATGSVEFESTHVDGPFDAVAAGDVDGDEGIELAAVSFESESGYGDGILSVHEGAGYETSWESGPDLFLGSAWTGIHDAAVADVDGDGRGEILVGTDRLYDGALHVVDAVGHVVQQRWFFDDGSPLEAIATADMDADGFPEIVAGNSREHTGSPGVYVYVIDGLDGGVEWKSTALPVTYWGGVADVATGRLVGSATPDIVALAGSLFLYDGETHQRRDSFRTDYTAVEVADTNADAAVELFAGRADGRFVRMDANLVESSPVDVCGGGAVRALEAGIGALAGTMAFACPTNIGIYGFAEQRVLWRSGSLAAPARTGNLVIMDRGDEADLVVGTSTSVVAFRGTGRAGRDTDGDGEPNWNDNCPDVANPGQEDRDSDSVGDACNDDDDSDGDEWADGRDDCPDVPDPLQLDQDDDGTGDACNDADDGDGDEWSDELDNCPAAANQDQADGDGDAIGNVCDPYPDDPDNEAARCAEAEERVVELEAELEICEARPAAVDTDSDGEADATDRCASSRAGAGVDAEGCSRAQFCRRSGRGSAGMQRCVAADWKNDEPMTLTPEDCRVGGTTAKPVCKPK